MKRSTICTWSVLLIRPLFRVFSDKKCLEHRHYSGSGWRPWQILQIDHIGSPPIRLAPYICSPSRQKFLVSRPSHCSLYLSLLAVCLRLATLVVDHIIIVHLESAERTIVTICYNVRIIRVLAIQVGCISLLVTEIKVAAHAWARDVIEAGVHQFAPCFDTLGCICRK